MSGLFNGKYYGFFLIVQVNKYVLAQNTSQREVWSTWLSGHMR